MLEKFIIVCIMCMAQSVCHTDQWFYSAAIFVKDEAIWTIGHNQVKYMWLSPIATVDSLEKNNWQITTHKIVDEMSMSKRNVHTLLHEKLQYQKVCM